MAMAGPYCNVVLLFLVASCLTFSRCACFQMELTQAPAPETAHLVEDDALGGDRHLLGVPPGLELAVPAHRAGKFFAAEFSIGTPPQRVEALIDTGSDIVWTRCASGAAAADAAVAAAQAPPLFDPSKSSSLAPVPCDAAACAALPLRSCANATCRYEARYGAGNATGVLVTDTVAFGSDTVRLTMGCVTGYRVRAELDAFGTFGGTCGIVGLSRSPLSLPRQLNATKFSYCLSPRRRSKLFVGHDAQLNPTSGRIQTMEFVKNPTSNTSQAQGKYYYLPLQGISVGAKRVPVAAETFALVRVAPDTWKGGVFIDSGSSATGLVPEAYYPLKAEVVRQLGANRTAFESARFDLCFPLPPPRRLDDLPGVTFHFAGGADMELPPANVFKKENATTACMTLMPGMWTNIIGNYQQRNFHLLFDLAAGTLSFQRADCDAL